MKEQIEARLKELQAQQQKGAQLSRDLENQNREFTQQYQAKRGELTSSQLRIDGAISVLTEMLEKLGKGSEAAPAAKSAPLALVPPAAAVDAAAPPEITPPEGEAAASVPQPGPAPKSKDRKP